ncbi:hypothetical protein Tco_0293831, partial [Tanacetum coccineum]
MMMDPNLQVIMERRFMKIQEKKVNVMIKRRKIMLTTLTMLMLLSQMNVVGGKTSIKLPFRYHDDGSKPSSDNGKKVYEDPRKE